MSDWTEEMVNNYPLSVVEAIKVRDNLIKAMEKNIKNLEAKKDQSAWVSVDDGLPESHREYLVYDGSDVYECLLIRDKWDTAGIVTHWQPLPLPPTQEA